MKPIILIGFMGVGKTSLGKKLAKELGWEFVDTDKWIEKKVNLKIIEIFKAHGEDYFREVESSCLNELINLRNTVISVGGGLPCFGENMSMLNSFGCTIYLKLEVKEIVKRIGQSKISRPLLDNLDSVEMETFILKTLYERERFYSMAKYTIRPDIYFIDNSLLKYFEFKSQFSK
ncbi:MAG: shikimate kinase [Bacteroidota bacterium]